MSTAFPGAVDTAATLYDVVNNATSTLSGSHTAGGSTLDLVSAALFPSTGGIIYVGNERTTYTGKTSNQLTGMAALSNNYPAGTIVAMYEDAEHHNVLRAAIVATQARLGETGSTTAGTITKRVADLEAASLSVEAQIHAAAGKTTPADADELGITDSAGAWTLKGLTLANLKAALKTYFDALSTTLTNKRITARVGSTTSSATPTINTDNVDVYKLTAQTADITSFTTNLSGTPTDGQALVIQITGTAARAITWGTSFEASTVALPTTTVSTNMLTVGFIYNGVTSKWRCVGSV